MKDYRKNNKYVNGFSLVEMAVVLVILGFVITVLILPVTAQREASFLRQTENQLAIAQKALIGFAQVNGRLPCPATPNSQGMEFIQVPAINGGGQCDPSAQLLPAATLGIKPINNQGQAVDGWGNPIHYQVAQSSQGGNALPDFTTTNDMATVGITLLKPELRVCATGSSVDCSDTKYLINNAVAVIYSTGAVGAQGPRSSDETINLDQSNVFISRDINTMDFDDLVTWISPYVLYNAMIQAGQLP